MRWITSPLGTAAFWFLSTARPLLRPSFRSCWTSQGRSTWRSSSCASVVPVFPDANARAPRLIAEDLAERTAEARDHLGAIAADLMARGVRVQTRVRSGTPVTEILAAARDSATDLIAMTTRGRTGLSRLVFGSVAEAVVRLAECPVLLMRLTAAEAHIRAARGDHEPLASTA